MSIDPPQTVLVTGGAGRLGRLVVDALRSRGTRTLSISRASTDGHPDDLVADIGDPDSVIAAVQGLAVDRIVHLAAAVRGDGIMEANRRIDIGLRSLIRAVAPSGVILASSGAVYGDESTEAFSEESPALGASPYALAKLASEQSLRDMNLESPSMSVTILRVFNVAGPSFPDSLVQRLLEADEVRPVQLMCPDSFVRDYIHQADVVSVVLAAADRTEPGQRVFNVGAGAGISSRLLLKSLAVKDRVWVEVEGQASSNWSNNAAAVAWSGITPSTGPSVAWGQTHIIPRP